MNALANPVLPKAPYGSPCNRCGRCCVRELCPLGALVFKRIAGPCPALLRGEGLAMVCGLVNTPMVFAPVQTLRRGAAAMSAAAALLTGVGVGCDAPLGEPVDNPAFKAKMRRVAAELRPKVGPALATWGIGS